MPQRPETEVWFRNPAGYVRELAEVGAHNITFDGAYIAKRRIDPVAFCLTYFGLNALWQAAVIYPDRTVLYDQDHLRSPAAVFPTWSARHQPISDLIALMKRPWADREWPETNAVDQRSVPDQKHWIFITDLPNMNHSVNRDFMADLSEFQREHDEVTFFIHGLYSFGVTFGNRFKAMDFDARYTAANGRITLPAGQLVEPSRLRGNTYWVQMMGFDLHDMIVPRNRCMYNIKSALFAGTYYNTLFRFAIGKRQRNVPIDSQLAEIYIKENSLIFTKRLVARPGDRVVCDDCSLWLSCKYYREGAVCAVPESEMSKVGDLFGTRSAENIKKALTRLVQANVDRIERGMRAEATPYPEGHEDAGVEKPVDPALNKLMGDTFAMGHKLLMIEDPTQRPGKPAVNVNVNGGNQAVAITSGDDQVLVSQVYTMLESRGYQRDQITEEMVRDALQELMQDQPRAILPGETVP